MVRRDITRRIKKMKRAETKKRNAQKRNAQKRSITRRNACNTTQKILDGGLQRHFWILNFWYYSYSEASRCFCALPSVSFFVFARYWAFLRVTECFCALLSVSFFCFCAFHSFVSPRNDAYLSARFFLFFFFFFRIIPESFRFFSFIRELAPFSSGYSTRNFFQPPLQKQSSENQAFFYLAHIFFFSTQQGQQPKINTRNANSLQIIHSY